MNNNDPYQRLMFAVWAQALNDINRGYLLKAGVLSFDNPDKEKKIKDDAQAALDWVYKPAETFDLVAYIYNISPDIFKRKTIKIVEENKKKIEQRSKTTNEYMYATVSRFRNYEKAFKRSNTYADIISS